MFANIKAMLDLWILITGKVKIVPVFHKFTGEILEYGLNKWPKSKRRKISHFKDFS